MQDGTERRFTYVETRYFYCRQYELLAPATEAFQKLQSLIKTGHNLLIVGYDGYDVTRSLWDHYLDTSRPFGHELALYTLLTVSDPVMYPWNIYKRQHPDVYADYAF